MIEIKKEKNCEIGFKHGTRQKLTRIIEQVKRRYDLMFEKTFFLLSFSYVRFTFKFQPLGVIFSFLFPVTESLKITITYTRKFQVESGGQCPPHPPLAPPLLTTIKKTKTKTKANQRSNLRRKSERERCGSIWVSRFGNLTICGSS